MRNHCLLPVLSITLIAQPSSAQSKVDLQIIPESPQFSGCGLGLKYSTAKADDPRLVFWCDFGSEAIVHISGKQHRLKAVSDSETRKGSSKVFTEEWSDNEIKVKIVYRITKNYGESSDLKGTITVISGSQVKDYKVVGFKGC